MPGEETDPSEVCSFCGRPRDDSFLHVSAKALLEGITYEVRVCDQCVGDMAMVVFDAVGRIGVGR